MSYTYLQEQEEGFSVENSLDIPQFARLKLNPIAEKSYCKDSGMESFQGSPSGMTSAHSMGDPGEEQLTFSAAAFRARTSVPRVKAQELPAHVQDFGKSMQESLERFGLALSLPKTHLSCGLEDLELSSKIWPRRGIMQDGEFWELGTSVRLIDETECGYWLPTPDASERGPCKAYNPRAKSQSGRTLQTLAACDPHGTKWPTPTAAEGTKIGNQPNYGQIGLSNHPKIVGLPDRPKGQKSQAGGNKTQQKWGTPRCFMHKDSLTDRGKGNLGEQVNGLENVKKTGQLNPNWVEWLMGWLIGWTALKPLGMDRFQQWQQQHSEFSAKD